METSEIFNPKDLFGAVHDLEKLKYLVEKYYDVIDINLVDDKENTVFDYTLWDELTEQAKYLTEKFRNRININKLDKYGNTILNNYCDCNDEDIEDSDVIKFVVENFKDTININQKSKYGNNALMITCSQPNHSLTEFFIENFKDSIDINQTNEYGNNAFMLACEAGCPSIVKLLIENYGEIIDINQVNKYGDNALILACISADKNNTDEDLKETIYLILKKYNDIIDLNKKNNLGQGVYSFRGCSIAKIEEEYSNLDKFKPIKKVLLKIGDTIKCFTLDESLDYTEKGIRKDKSKLLLTLDTDYKYTTRYGRDDEDIIFYNNSM